MKKPIAVVALALVAALSPAAVAAGAIGPETFQDFEAKSFAGDRPGKVARAGSIGTYLHPFHNRTWPTVSNKTGGALQVSPPFASVISFVYLDRNVTFNADPFPGCPKDKVLALDPEVKGAAAAGCPKESQLGEGTAAGFARAVNGAPGKALLRPTLQTRVFASGLKDTIYLYTYAEATKGNVIVGTLEKYRDKRYGSRIRFVLPKGLIQPNPGLVSQLSTFDDTIPAQSYNGHVLIRLNKCPSSRKLYAGYQGIYSNNAKAKPGVNPVDGNDFVVSGQSKIITRSGKCR